MHEAARLATCSPLPLAVHAAFFSCSSVDEFGKTAYIGPRDVVSHQVAPMCSGLSLSSQRST